MRNGDLRNISEQLNDPFAEFECNCEATFQGK